ncbi:TolC family protein [Roseateles sp.]|uniref:TolC family protein n=1 Tax=Roseateles sp. TaxID=1971397 RepID=UPI003D09F17B
MRTPFLISFVPVPVRMTRAAALLSLCALALLSPGLRAQTPEPVPAASLSLPQALNLALSHNPDLAVARLELQAQEAAEQQAGVGPNPELSLLIEDTRRASRSSTVQWSQALELGGKRAARVAAAAHAREQAAVGLQARQAELQAAVSTAFFDLLAAQEQLSLSESAMQLAERSVQAVQLRLQAGKVAPLELHKAQVAAGAVRADLAQARSELSLARQRLAALWGGAEARFERAEGLAEQMPPSSAEVAPSSTALDEAPALRLARLDIARRQALTAGERAKRVPDVTVSLGAKREAETGRSMAVIGLSLPLPLRDRNEGNLLEALKREEQAREQLAAAQVRLRLDLAQAQERLRQTRLQQLSLRVQQLPLAQTAFDTALRGYELGKFAFIDVLDAQRSLFQLRQQALRQSAEAWRAAAEIARLLGLPPFAVQPTTQQDTTS